MKTSTIAWIIIILVVVGGGWYWWSMQAADQMTAATDTAQQPSTDAGLNGTAGETSTAPIATPVLGVAQDPTLGAMLVAPSGMTLYKYTKDTAGVSNCSGQCAVNWPPYTVSGTEPLVAATGIAGTLATITRADGTMQVTYNGVPLYYWVKDTKPGETTGQGVGKVWYVVAP